MARYVRHPAIADSRIINYDTKNVTFVYKREGKTYTVLMDKYEFIHNVIKHIPDKNFKMVRYFGIHARRAKIHSVLYTETFKLINNIKNENKNEISIPDKLIKYFNDNQIKEKLTSIQETIRNFQNASEPYLNQLKKTSGKNFLKDAYWLKLMNDLNSAISGFKYKGASLFCVGRLT